MQVTENHYSLRGHSRPIGPLGRAVALWAIICAVAVTEAGSVIGDLLGMGAAILWAPLLIAGVPVSAMPIVFFGLAVVALSGGVQLTIGLRWKSFGSLAPRGVHLIGLSVATGLCLVGTGLA